MSLGFQEVDWDKIKFHNSARIEFFSAPDKLIMTTGSSSHRRFMLDTFADEHHVIRCARQMANTLRKRKIVRYSILGVQVLIHLLKTSSRREQKRIKTE
jgi:hypothetical protein